MGKDEARCPYCGDPMGYEYSRRCIDRRVGSWDGKSESAELVYISIVPATVVCLTCGRRQLNPELEPHP